MGELLIWKLIRKNFLYKLKYEFSFLSCYMSCHVQVFYPFPLEHFHPIAIPEVLVRMWCVRRISIWKYAFVQVTWWIFHYEIAVLTAESQSQAMVTLLHFILWKRHMDRRANNMARRPPNYNQYDSASYFFWLANIVTPFNVTVLRWLLIIQIEVDKIGFISGM